MNIHITEAEFNELNQGVLAKVVIGSHLYKLSNKDSDTDILSITANREDNLHSVVQLHHQYQYKANNTDYLFCSLQSFVKNLIMGDSTINFEALYSEEIRSHQDLSFLYDFRKNFYNYNLIRAYLGLVRRDLKVFKKEKNNKRLFHALRGLLTAKALINKQEYSNDFAQMDQEVAITLNKIKQSELSVEEEKVLAINLLLEVDQVRDNLNRSLDRKEIEKVMNLDKLKELDTWMIAYSKKTSVKGSFINDQFYAAIQEEIKYE